MGLKQAPRVMLRRVATSGVLVFALSISASDAALALGL